MLRLCQRFGSRQSIYLRPSQMEYNSPILSAGLSCLQNTITQSKHRPLNQIYSRNFIKTVFGQPNDPATINIYNGTFAIRLEFLKLFAMVTTFVGVGNYKEIYGAISELGGLVTTVALCSLSTIAIGSIPAAIHLFSKKYVVEMRHNPQTDEYSVALISLWMSKKWIKFKVGDIEVPEKQRMFTLILVGKDKIPILIIERDFVDHKHYSRFMMGDTSRTFNTIQYKNKLLKTIEKQNMTTPKNR